MLSFSITNEGKAIQIDCDAKGMSVLLKALAELVGEHAGHTHLLAFTGDICETILWGKPKVPEVIIYYAESGSN